MDSITDRPDMTSAKTQINKQTNEQWDIFSLIDILLAYHPASPAGFEPAWKGYLASQKLYALQTTEI